MRSRRDWWPAIALVISAFKLPSEERCFAPPDSAVATLSCASGASSPCSQKPERLTTVIASVCNFANPLVCSALPSIAADSVFNHGIRTLISRRIDRASPSSATAHAISSESTSPRSSVKAKQRSRRWAACPDSICQRKNSACPCTTGLARHDSTCAAQRRNSSMLTDSVRRSSLVWARVVLNNLRVSAAPANCVVDTIGCRTRSAHACLSASKCAARLPLSTVDT